MKTEKGVWSIQTVLILQTNPAKTFKGAPYLRVQYRAAVDGSQPKWASCFRKTIFSEVEIAKAEARPIGLEIELAEKRDHDGERYINITGIEDKRQVNMFVEGKTELQIAMDKAKHEG